MPIPLKDIFIIYSKGIVILIIAILANASAAFGSFITWYDWFKMIDQIGFKTTLYSTPLSSLIWLLIIYPLILGTSTLIIIKLDKYF